MHEVADELGSVVEAHGRVFERHRFDFNPENLVERDSLGEDLAHDVERLWLVTHEPGLYREPRARLGVP